MVLQFIVSVGLIIAVLIQTTKSEGLSGTIGGSRETIFKGKKGAEELVEKITSFLAIAFLIFSLLTALFA
jgi:preprotein translocase subunit SecG